MHPEAIAAMIIRGCDTAEQQVHDAVAAAPAIIHKALDAVRVGWPVGVPLPGFAKDKIADLIMAAVHKAADVILEAIAMLRLLAKSAGRPSVLRAAATTLSTSVGTVGSTLSSSMTTRALSGLDDDGWDSPASDSYSTAFNEQSRAVDKVSDSSGDLASALNGMADSLESFFFDLEFAYAGFVVAVAGLAAAIVSAAPTLGVGAVVGIIIAVVSFIAAVAALVLAFTNASSRSSDLADGLSTSVVASWPTSSFAR